MSAAPLDEGARDLRSNVKHSLTIAGHRTSISLERAFWERLKRIAAERGSSLAACVAEIDAARGSANLSSAIRVYILQSALSPEAGE
ncbi:siderophore biosynthesis protein-like protein [Methylocella silvestris BL2]|uniref:Siderophore biosynthesis protein-like protein n=1 Tax=Methylocella silvestris (strain DSM 15510 / CIP 108128 / LMG 27833 / NCIMB 13906 / BL2) TaxID=395965 RepID=B8ELI0_METSB|nr:ribbon-helix-helix domain-containing protein [Methylocella silvestris]ACK49569.1 siderophore biosynthesis protein-like protein [Methylocella silvestris BL2]